jgi:hypothetical protein
MLFDFKKEQKVTMNMKDMNYPLDMIFINMSKEVVAVRSLKPGNFETSVEGVRFVLEVNKDEGAGLVGELISCTSDFYPQLEWPKKLKRLLWTQKLKKKKKLRRVSQNTTPTSVNIIVRVSTVPENAKQLLRVAVVLKYTKIR